MSDDSSEDFAFAGSRFVRADLHVHTHADSAIDPQPDVDAYIAAAQAAGIDVLAITDHNHVRSVRAALEAAGGTELFVIPGVEISTHDGHLLALFPPDEVETLEALVHPENLHLTRVSETDVRSRRSMLDLIGEIGRRGGLAVPAHIDAPRGAGERLSGAEWTEVLLSPALAGVEFATREALETWFSDEDEDHGRRSAWAARQSAVDLGDRGLARLMSSDAHSPEKVGRDRSSRTLTRLRVDAITFDSLRNAIVFNPKARCKAEAVLPASYPTVLEARFEGGFLDGVKMRFSANLNCVIGGRGSGKSTALLAIRAALGATPVGEDVDAADRMPDATYVDFIDAAGSLRTAVRRRGQEAVDESGAPVRLRLADLGQDESGRLTRGYASDPRPILAFLDGFVVRHQFDEKERELISALSENAGEVKRTAFRQQHIDELDAERRRLEASLEAAKKSRVEDIAAWAVLLAAQGPLLDELRTMVDESIDPNVEINTIELDEIAAGFGVDLLSGPAASFVSGDQGLRALLATYEAARRTARTTSSQALTEAAEPVRQALNRWRDRHDELQTRLSKRRAELEEQGLKVQAEAVSSYANRLETVKRQLNTLSEQRKRHESAVKDRRRLVADLHANRDNLHRARTATIDRIVQQANKYSDELVIHVWFDRAGLNDVWANWLSNLSLRAPRSNRFADSMSPREFAASWSRDQSEILALRDPKDNQPFFAERVGSPSSWDAVFELETMICEDRPRLEVQRRGDKARHPLDRLSAGQQRSVLLSLLLCAERSEPLILDQPEDHLDGQYIASAVVRHLEAAKERRQILIATHSANLVVLGDAELVIPMRAHSERGVPDHPGAVDRPETRDRILSLLEGGSAAYRKRGARYGFRVDI